MNNLIKLFNALEDVIYDGGKDIEGFDYTKLDDLTIYLRQFISDEDFDNFSYEDMRTLDYNGLTDQEAFDRWMDECPVSYQHQDDVCDKEHTFTTYSFAIQDEENDND